jgi:hypothetical protein
MHGKAIMGILEWAALIVGGGLIVSGVRAIRRRQADVPEPILGKNAVRLGWLWVGLGVVFMLAGLFDIPPLMTFFRMFLEAAN